MNEIWSFGRFTGYPGSYYINMFDVKEFPELAKMVKYGVYDDMRKCLMSIMKKCRADFLNNLATRYIPPEPEKPIDVSLQLDKKSQEYKNAIKEYKEALEEYKKLRESRKRQIREYLKYIDEMNLKICLLRAANYIYELEIKEDEF